MKHDYRNNVVGGKHRAVNRYNLILYRLNRTDRRKNSSYKGIKMMIPKDDFVKWFMENDFKGASVDRIDKNSDYTLENIQLIPLAENIRKDKVKEKNGLCTCSICNETKQIELFVVDKRRKNGHGTICKKCDSSRKSTGRM